MIFAQICHDVWISLPDELFLLGLIFIPLITVLLILAYPMIWICELIFGEKIDREDSNN